MSFGRWTSRPPNIRPAGSKLVLKIKLDDHGALEHSKQDSAHAAIVKNQAMT